MTDSIDRAAAVLRYTCSIIGLPPMSARALPGSRDDAYRAGMTAIAETKGELRGGPKRETGGTSDITTTARAIMRVHGHGSAFIPRYSVLVRGSCLSADKSSSIGPKSIPGSIMKPTRAAAYVIGGMLL